MKVVPLMLFGVLKSVSGDTLFAINHPTTLHKLEQAFKAKFFQQIPDKCTSADWNNETIMNHPYKKNIWTRL